MCFKKSVFYKISFYLLDPPGSPGSVEGQEVGADFVSLTWQKPVSDGGGNIIGYYIEKKEANSENWMRCNNTPVNATIYNVPNLIEDREYDFRVVAVNEAGESKPAETDRRIKVKDPKGSIVYLFQVKCVNEYFVNVCTLKVNLRLLEIYF